MPEPRLTLVSQALDEAAMTTLSRAVAGALQAPCTVYLRGSLGAGKTTFTRALIQALGHAGRVKSPTYGLLEHYELAGVNVLHLDLYRIGDPGELDFLGIEDLCDDRTLLLVEWPEQGGSVLPPADLEIVFSPGPGNGFDSRRLMFYAYSDSGVRLGQFIEALL
jgi:tRNA threonylcarbamoyladenosine biosynthesis protein TsaE